MLSVGMKGECWDNAVAESFFATIKRELIETRRGRRAPDSDRAVFDYIEGWYNTSRRHTRSATRAPPSEAINPTPTVRPHDQLKKPVRRTGASPGVCRQGQWLEVRTVR